MPANESIFSLLVQGFELMIIGMGIVFAFLALLVFVVNWMSGVLQKFFPEVPVVAHQPRSVSPVKSAMNDQQVVSVISAAIHQHRNKRKK